MWKRIAFTLAVILCAFAAYVTLFDVKREDVIAYNKLDVSVASEPFRAGDLVGYSPDGQTPTGRICAMNIEPEQIDDFPLSKIYSNGWRDSLPDFAILVGWARGLIGSSAPERPELSTPAAVPFVGQISTVRDAVVNPMMTDDCACAVAQALVQRQKVCTVRKSLVETVLVPIDPNDPSAGEQVRRRTIGATFRSTSIVIPDLAALNCPDLNLEARAPAQVHDCSDLARRSPDVFLRDKLGVIREKPFVYEALQPRTN